MPASGPGLSYADDATALRAALDTIVGEIPCEFQLDGVVSDVATARDQGVVTVGGAPVDLDPVDGWYLESDGRTFTLNGAACEDFRDSPGAELEATFPCGSGIVIIPL